MYLIWMILCYSTCFSSAANILMFGGNGFIGSECSYQLLQKGHNITHVSRGSSIYDYNTRIKPYITHIPCDRYRGLAECQILKEKDSHYDFIVDFSAYHPSIIQDAVNYLNGKFHTYIYISSDSVYEVSIPTNNKFSKESDAKRYASPEDQQKANQKDSYGNHKFQGEEILYEESSQNGFKYIALRLPDVIGPRDTTLRWWTYQAWFQFVGSAGKPMILPKGFQNLATSYVYVKDVAKVIAYVIEHIDNIELKSFNIGFSKPVTLRQLLDYMQEALEIQGVEYNYSDESYFLYPSVTRGPIDISLAENILKFKPTSWNTAVNETVMFYKTALSTFLHERARMMEGLKSLSNDVPDIDEKIEDYIKLGSQKQKYKNHDEL